MPSPPRGTDGPSPLYPPRGRRQSTFAAYMTGAEELEEEAGAAVRKQSVQFGGVGDTAPERKQSVQFGVVGDTAQHPETKQSIQLPLAERKQSVGFWAGRAFAAQDAFEQQRRTSLRRPSAMAEAGAPGAGAFGRRKSSIRFSTEGMLSGQSGGAGFFERRRSSAFAARRRSSAARFSQDSFFIGDLSRRDSAALTFSRRDSEMGANEEERMRRMLIEKAAETERHNAARTMQRCWRSRKSRKMLAAWRGAIRGAFIDEKALAAGAEDNPLYRDAALAARHLLRNDAQVIQSLEQSWEICLEAAQNGWYLSGGDANGRPMPTESLPKEVYMTLTRKCYLAALLSDNVAEVSADDFESTAEEDWLVDSRGEEELSKDAFFDAMFQLADVSTESVDADEYAGFMTCLLYTTDAADDRIRV